MQIVMFTEKVFNVCKGCQIALLNTTGMCPPNMPRPWDKSKADLILLHPSTRIDQYKLIVSDDIVKIIILERLYSFSIPPQFSKKYLNYHFCK